MSNEFYTILTNAGLAAIANASVSNATVDFAKVAVGDGNGAYYTPTRDMTALRRQTWIGPVASVQVDESNPNWINVESVIPATDGGFYIREIGIFNEANVLLAVGKLPETYKPSMESGSTKDLYLKAIFEVTNANVVSLKADPSVVLASKKYLDDKVGIVSGNLRTLQQQVTQHLAQSEYQKPTISGTQIRLQKPTESNRIFFNLDADLNGSITISTDNGATSKKLVDVDGVQVMLLEKGFHEIVASANFFILRNRGLSKAQLQALITIVNEAEANESVLRTNYVNAVNDADDSISLPPSATWNDILMQIPNIKNENRKATTGTSLTSRDSASFSYYSDNSTLSLKYFDIENLGFKPSLILALSDSNHATYYAAELSDRKEFCTTGVSNPKTASSTHYTVKLGSSDGQVNQNLVRLPTSAPTEGQVVSWIAIE